MPLLTTPRSLRLVVDTNILLGELLRQRGIDLITDPRLNLSITAKAWNEMEYELPKRIREYARHNPNQTQAQEELLRTSHSIAASNVRRIDESVYLSFEQEARLRIPDDPDDWPTVVLALALGVGIWSEDRHFLGYGLPTWWTDPLRAYLSADSVIRTNYG